MPLFPQYIFFLIPQLICTIGSIVKFFQLHDSLFNGSTYFEIIGMFLLIYSSSYALIRSSFSFGHDMPQSSFFLSSSFGSFILVARSHVYSRNDEHLVRAPESLRPFNSYSTGACFVRFFSFRSIHVNITIAT